MKKARAFCPSYITGIFTIGKADAAGAGFSIDKGMHTEVKEGGGTSVRINGKKSPAVVSRAVVAKYWKILGRKSPVEISHQAQLPIGFGCGMSAAGAVSLSLSLNELFGCGLSRAECVRIAHGSEVECGTGLSGADAAALGGFLARRSLREKPVRFPLGERKIHLAYFSSIRTSSIIRNPIWRRRVNPEGRRALAAFFSDASWNGFVRYSREFAASCTLASWCGKEMAANPSASMAMVGRTLFSGRKLQLAGGGFDLMEANTCERGAELV